MSATRDFSSRPRRPRPGGDTLFVGAGALLLGLSLWAAGLAWSDVRHAQGRVRQTRSEIEDAETRMQRGAPRPAASETLALQAVASATLPPQRVVADIGELLPSDVRLDTLALAYGERVGIVMAVTARSAAAYDAFLQRLELSPHFGAVAPGDEERSEGARGSVTATYAGAGR